MIATPQPLVVVQRIDAQASLSGVLRCTMFTLVMTGLLFTLSGCHSIEASHRQLTPPLEQIGVSNEIPREQCKVVLPDYTIEPPDILNIDAIRVLPRSPYKLRALDTVSVSAAAPLPDQPIEGPKQIELDGTVQLGGIYGSVRIAGMTREEAQQAIISHLRGTLKEPSVTLTLVQTASQQQVAGQHLVGPDGRITLGSYGKVLVVGMTVEEAKAAIEQHLSRYMDEPEVAVDVFGYNSKVYYIITQGGGMGDQAVRFPIVGNETVLDAVTQVNGLTAASSSRIWVARPGRSAHGCDQILPVDWMAISQRGSVETNYQLLPGDRVYIEEDKLVALDNKMAKLLAPIERVFGFTLLGASTLNGINNVNSRNFGSGF